MVNQKAQPAISIDPFLPAETAKRLEAVNVQRARLPVRSLLLLGVLGGLYIGFGGALATLVLTDNTLGFGLGRLVAGLAFSLGLIMLVVAGGELFTGNNLMVLALASRKVSAGDVLRNWVLVYAANAAGAALLAAAIHVSGILDGNGIKATAVRIAEAKALLDPLSAFVRGILCNMLVCLAVWLSVAARSVEGKVIAIALPISAFVALGFEHCIANFYLLPIGMLSGADISFVDLFGNIGVVTLGNTIGGVIVATAYHQVYLSHDQAQDLATARTQPADIDLTAAKWRVSGLASWPAIAPSARKTLPAQLPIAMTVGPPPRLGVGRRVPHAGRHHTTSNIGCSQVGPRIQERCLAAREILTVDYLNREDRANEEALTVGGFSAI
jgi:formate/nitrite transporter